MDFLPFSSLRSTLRVAVGLLLLSPLSAGAASVTTLARLGGDPNGYHPRAPPIDGGDGFFYGTTEAGGPPNGGTIFKFTPAGAQTTLRLFHAGGSSSPAELTEISSGVFCGVTERGGLQNKGTIFGVTSAGDIGNLHDFDPDKGTDYVFLKGTKKIKAGKTSKPIKIIPQRDLGGANKKTVKLVLAPGTGYTVGTTGKVKVSILGRTVVDAVAWCCGR